MNAELNLNVSCSRLTRNKKTENAMANEMVRDSISSTASSAPSNTSFLKLPESKSFSISNSSATSRSSRMDEEKGKFVGF